MLNVLDEAVADKIKITPAPSPTVVPEVKAQPTDSIFNPAPQQSVKEDPAPKKSSVFGRILRYAVRAVVAVCLCGLAWAGGSYYLRTHSLADFLKSGWIAGGQPSAQNDDVAATVKEMAEEVHTLKASVDALNAAQTAGGGNGENGQSLKTQLDSMQTATSAAIADLSDRIGKLETESSAKLSKINTQLDDIEHRVTPPRVTAASGGTPPRKRVEHTHDAFNPSQDPMAPGAPRPLGRYGAAYPPVQTPY
jgi:hypothetical protein